MSINENCTNEERRRESMGKSRQQGGVGWKGGGKSRRETWDRLDGYDGGCICSETVKSRIFRSVMAYNCIALNDFIDYS